MTKTKEAEILCAVCCQPIPKKRVEALKFLGTDLMDWACVEHSLTKKVKGLFTGEVGTSDLLIVDKLYNDSVRSVFKQSEAEADDSPELYEEEEKD